jgi:hypothetical protein
MEQKRDKRILKAARALVALQADDANVWLRKPQSIFEHALQLNLRHLHAVIEDDKSMIKYYDNQYKTTDGE